MKSTVIYHRADFDGIFCREIARKFIPDADLIGWDYNDPTIPIPTEGAVYILDLSPDCLCDNPDAETIWQRIIWIDHHKSAIEMYPMPINGYRIDGVAGCRLTWQWFFIHQHNAQNATNEAFQIPLPGKQEFVDRTVSEPWAVRLAGEYDIWDKRDPNAELFQHGLRSQDLTADDWSALFAWPEEKSGKLVVRLLNQGRTLQYAKEKENASIINAYGFTVDFEDLKFLACNHTQYNSFLFTAGVKPEHDALLGFNYDGKGKWRVSLYHAPGKEHHDLSKIAVKYGGGGHRGACGFVTDKLPFL